MELSGYTILELYDMVNKVKELQEKKKEEITALTYEMDELKKKVDIKFDELNKIEEDYVKIMMEYNGRE